MKTQEEIKKEIKALKAIRPKVRPYSAFGDDNLAALDAQVNVLENSMEDDDIYDMYDHADVLEYVLEVAIEAGCWLNGNSESGSLATDWPLKEGELDDNKNTT